MPFDGRQYQKADPFTLDRLIAWLETKDPAGTYCYLDHGGCLWHQYMSGHGIPVDSVFTDTWRDQSGGYHRLPWEWGVMVPLRSPHTFGAALARAKAYRNHLAKESV